MTTVLALTDAPDDVERFCANGEKVLLFRIAQLPTEQHDFAFFERQYRALTEQCDLSRVDLVVAEYVDSLPLLYFMRRDGYHCPALMIPHTNPYPLNILFYFLLVAAHPHPGDLVICGSTNAANAYRRLTGIPARNTCTFGIRNVYRRRDRAASRAALGLPADRRVLLYTGRFMNDKGLGALIEAYHLVRRERPEALLVMSVTHVDPPYYNRLAPRLTDAVLFQRLDRAATVDLYNAADLYWSGATSIFETYGKAPLEALACGVPVVVPRWDGFPYFIGSHNGALAEVEPVEAGVSPYDFARVRADDLAAKCLEVLDRTDGPEIALPAWGTYDHTMGVLADLVGELAATGRTRTAPDPDRPLPVDRLPASVRAVLDHHGLRTTRDVVVDAQRQGLVDRRSPGDPVLLRRLHDDVFGPMAADPATVAAEAPRFVTT
ncbi:glycosyltransferase family 4 protein [Actinosynnema sp. NPDC059335]|uniref:glycosyltransferase family 4 protein n=1 Tax=Actinosynnema sp. NPDC059335 TaxID=3346804 RepID=UPI0036701643